MQIPFLSDLMVSRFQTKISPEKPLSWSCKKCFTQASGNFMLRAKMSFIIIARTVLIGDTNEGQGQWPVSQSFEWFRVPIHDFEAYAVYHLQQETSLKFPHLILQVKPCQDTPHSLLQPLHLERYNWQGNNLPLCRYLHPAAMETVGKKNTEKSRTQTPLLY